MQGPPLDGVESVQPSIRRRRARERLLASPSPFPLAAAAVCIGTTGAAVRPDGGGINNGVLCLVSERFGPQASDMLVPVGNSASSLEGWKDDYSANDTGSSKKNPAKFRDACSVRVDGLCIGCLGQCAGRGRVIQTCRNFFARPCRHKIVFPFFLVCKTDGSQSERTNWQ